VVECLTVLLINVYYLGPVGLSISPCSGAFFQPPQRLYPRQSSTSHSQFTTFGYKCAGAEFPASRVQLLSPEHFSGCGWLAYPPTHMSLLSDWQLVFLIRASWLSDDRLGTHSSLSMGVHAQETFPIIITGARLRNGAYGNQFGNFVKCHIRVDWQAIAWPNAFSLCLQDLYSFKVTVLRVGGVFFSPEPLTLSFDVTLSLVLLPVHFHNEPIWNNLCHVIWLDGCSIIDQHLKRFMSCDMVGWA
jgi:hypothetical protein